MAGMAAQDDDIMADINVTPFVDVVLVLLIILMVTSTSIVKASLRVDLPKAASGGASVDSTLNVVIEKDGTLFLDGVEVNEAELRAGVVSAKKSDPKVRAVISADTAISYGGVVRVIDLAKLSGVASFALNIERTGENEAPAIR